MYKISADDPVTVDNLRRKYVYFLGNFMGGNNDWHGGTLAEIHRATPPKKCPFSQEPGFSMTFSLDFSSSINAKNPASIINGSIGEKKEKNKSVTNLDALKPAVQTKEQLYHWRDVFESVVKSEIGLNKIAR